MLLRFTLAYTLGFWLPSALALGRTPSDTADTKAWRPQYHFSARENWINDPAALVYYDSEYHLFYQYNPQGKTWGHSSWGHAISRDLVHWDDLPIAITETPTGMALAGSCVIDKQNTSGFGREGGRPPMVALYTIATRDSQQQYVSYSLDKGRTWAPYTNNPVIESGSKNLRNPNVFWHTPAGRWVMLLTAPDEQKVLFYTSANLKSWTKSGEFTSAETVQVTQKSGWETANLVELPIEGSLQKRWLLMVSVRPAADRTPSGTVYFVGSFDGRTFVSDAPTQAARPLDWGRDYYAAHTFSNMPIRGVRGPISIGWMSNWQYAADVPTFPFRGFLSLPRELRLIPADTGHELRQLPIQELKSLLGPMFQWNGSDTRLLNKTLEADGFRNDTYQMQIEISPSKAGAGVRLFRGTGQETLIGYDAEKEQLYLDRSRSGQTAFSKHFAARMAAPVKPQNGLLKLQIWVDRSSVEVFANDGQAAISSQIFPDAEKRSIQFYGEGLRSATIRPVETIWK